MTIWASFALLFGLASALTAFNTRHQFLLGRKSFASLSGKAKEADMAASVFETSGNVMPLSRFMIEATRANPDHADLESLVESIQIACKSIANMLSRNGVSDLAGERASRKTLANNVNENFMYSRASRILKNALSFTGKVGVISFDNEEQPVLIEEAWNSKYIAVFDPLDGALNIDMGIVTGTIFGIFREDDQCLVDYGENVSKEAKEQLLKTLLPDKNLVAAGYCIYSSATVLMMSLGDGLHGFTLDPYIGEFVLTHPEVRIPERGNVYSFNEARAPWWPAGLQEYVKDIKQGQGETGQTYTSRYIGSLVGDVHRTILTGGIFGYPGDSKSAPQGKLRLLHEVSPLAFLVEQAGGKASTGTIGQRILDVQVKTLHDHVPTFLGSSEDVMEVERYIAKHNA